MNTAWRINSLPFHRTLRALVSLACSGLLWAGALLDASGAAGQRDSPAGARSAARSRAGSVQVVGDHVYIASERDGLKVFDVGDPARPRLVSGQLGGSWTWGVQVRGDVLLLGAGMQGLMVFDVSRRAEPKLVTNYFTSTDCFTQGLHVVDDFAYVIDRNAGVVVLDVRHSMAPRRVGSFQVQGARCCESAGRLLCAGGECALLVLDVSDPTAPKAVGQLELGAEINDIHLVGDRAYVAGLLVGSGRRAGESLAIIDLSDPAKPRREGGWGPASTPAGQSVQVVGDFAYLADQLQGLYVVNVSRPSQAVQAGHSRIPWAKGVQVVEGRAYVSWFNASTDISGLEVVDVRNPARPERLGQGRDPAAEARHTSRAITGYAGSAAWLVGLVLAGMGIATIPAILVLAGLHFSSTDRRVRHPFLASLTLNVLLAIGFVGWLLVKAHRSPHLEIEGGVIFLVIAIVVLVSFPLGALVTAFLYRRFDRSRLASSAAAASHTHQKKE